MSNCLLCPSRHLEWYDHYTQVVDYCVRILPLSRPRQHLDKLRMAQSTYDPCLMYSTNNTSFGLVRLQTDDTLIVADNTFTEAEEVELQKAGFIAKKREQLTKGNKLKFNGRDITLQSDNSITITQESYNTILQVVTTTADLVSSRGTIRRDVLIQD
jgi:hypothetical protein